MTSEGISREPKLMDRVRHALRVKHYSIRTEDAYTNSRLEVESCCFLRW